MAAHSRYTNQRENTDRIFITFEREDWLAKIPQISAPMYLPHGRPIGPSILDQIEMIEVERRTLAPALRDQVDPNLRLVNLWRLRPHQDFLEPPKIAIDASSPLAAVARKLHPYKTHLVSTGDKVQENIYVEIVKRSSISISATVFRLAVGMYGDVSKAYTTIAEDAKAAWSKDLERASLIINMLDYEFKIEDAAIRNLRPLSSISEAIEQQILRDACRWLGVDPDLDTRRPRGRPKHAAPAGMTDGGEYIGIKIVDGIITGTLLKSVNNYPEKMPLGNITVNQIVNILEFLFGLEDQTDFELLTNYLDVLHPDWRAETEEKSGSDSADAYEILGVTRDMSIEEIQKIYRRMMQTLHPDKSGMSDYFSKVVSTAFKQIKSEKESS